ncbi:MAG: hypothetical protein J7L15_02920 [Clostridiales bacterium]|nr:hypothetical protein [Clostridiales bacterium]
MAKKVNQKVSDTLLKNLKGFASKGALFESPGNVPTGHFSLDFAIQYGMNPARVDLSNLEGYDPSEPLGLPLGKVVEIFGEEGSGKSSLAYRVAGFAQKLGYPVSWIDTEHSFSKDLAKINGCDINNIYYSNLVNTDNPEKNFHAEDIIDNICKMCEGGIKVVVLDSVANLVPKARFEADSEQKYMGLLSRLLSENFGKIVSYAEKYGTLLIFINQLRENLSITWGDSETSPGGRSLKHNASLRLKARRKYNKEADIYLPNEETGEAILIGRYVNISIVKNRLAKPYKESLQIPIYYEPYFPDIEDIAFDTGRQIKLITVMKEVYKWGEIRVPGRKGFIDHIKSSNLLDDLIFAIKNKAEENNVLLPPEIMQYKLKSNKKDKGSKLDEVGGKIQGSRSGKNSRDSKKDIKKT